VPEPLGGAHNDAAVASENLKTALLRHLEEVLALPPQERMKKRYDKFRAFGHVMEKQKATAVAAAS
jgi:acetyl-CoA carboxylase carboxyl transferase subunit alpha